MVEELLPASVTVVPEVNVNERIALRLDGLLDKFHPCVLWSSAAFLNVALGAGADYVFPSCLAAHSHADNVVERQFTGCKAFAAILAAVLVASEDVSTIKLHVVSRQTVVE